MKIEFKLNMPNVGSWNGKWSGESNYYAIVKSIRSIEKAREILSKSSYYYNFGDGWGMSISVKEIDTKEAMKIKKKSNGFCGYDWAIESIIDYGKILTEKPKMLSELTAEEMGNIVQLLRNSK